MRVTFDADGQMGLQEVDDFTNFAAHADCAPEALDTRLGGAARREGDAHLWIDRQWILESGRPADPEWRTGLNKMMAFAESRGWVDAEGAIRAHLVWSDPGSSNKT